MKRLAILLMLVACSSTPAPTAPVGGSESCETVCPRLRSMSCRLGQPTPRGASCETVCTTTHLETGGAGYPLHCLSTARTCVEVDACR